MTKAGSRLISAAKEAVAIARGKKKPGGGAGMKRLTVFFEPRPDGGLRVWSDDLPGLVLSGPDRDAVLDDLPAILKELPWPPIPNKKSG